ncbi:hypothetical protein JRO89_XS01G0021000 [Xanthoceras sorbifolium]|uniref:MATH domain-containing protein n=1 Tax=Xanthoceras sorbifolium TaxID=99658 RepID=A0ABQ8IHV0_9ROSI|nr:hypothetical protein JRO89_XS01G0021000 [Xanthoceras sorbifolium]
MVCTAVNLLSEIGKLMNLKENFSHCFDSKVGWGCHDFMPLKDINGPFNGYLKDDTSIVEVEFDVISSFKSGVMATAKFDVEKFNGENDFSLWRVKMLVHQGLAKALKGKDALPKSMSDKDKDDILEKAHSAILLSLDDEILREVSEEDTATKL